MTKSKECHFINICGNKGKYFIEYANAKMFVCFDCGRDFAEEADVLIDGSSPTYD